ncbi:hypothetical protein E3E14_04100 [Streptomyces sp. ICN441]|uniref:Secreted protein n=1 Tax=Streptomyces tirandamycinicus TaxID=2174846 RepID=A0A2S1SND0_9ACTN|nr:MULTISPECIES: hypothetical protein [Streptomyces]AWI27910.1 hypothetical protein DDW44_03245 [Streptomyces tirandamycinicus]MCY0982282.1 hypothetical protein [Streptomyces tirandamycinicus]NNJ05230.1 hypothetical protein [Streptomyces sp. PKU-MA01144]TFE56813.1 hypothetical protein E3E14_04100 [Streptomyces sp. ICN441]
MSTGTLIAIIVPIVVVLLLVAVAVRLAGRRRRLRERFGPEYDRTVESGDSRRAAERELRSREERHADLDIRELPAEARDRYAAEWTAVQERFVDEPSRCVDDADRLVTRLMSDRGYPTEGYEQQVRDLSVEHGDTLEHYRSAHDIGLRNREGRATTEELRGAMVHYRALFQELLGAPPATPGPAADTRRRHDAA